MIRFNALCQAVPSSFPSTCHLRLSTLLPCHPTTTSASSGIFVPRHSLTSTRARSSFGRGLAARSARRGMLFFCPEPFYDRDAPPACRLGSRAAALVLQPENLTGGLPHSDVDQSIARHDGTFFDKNMGALSAYAKGVL